MEFDLIFSDLCFKSVVYNVVPIRINVYGNLYVFLSGTEAWVQKLTWPGLAQFNKVNWGPEYVESRPAGDTAYFVKNYENFSFFWILKAGHLVNTIHLHFEAVNKESMI